MKFSATELHAIESIHIRAAKNLMAEKGGQNWTKADQVQYDSYLDRAELARDDREKLSNQRFAVELFVCKEMNAMSRSEHSIVRNWMSTTTGSQGGYSVPSLVAPEVISAMKLPSPMRQACSQMTTATGADMPYPTSDGTSEIGEQIAQNSNSNNSDPIFGTAPLTTYKFSSKGFSVPLELLQDMRADAVGFVVQRAGERIGRIQNAKFTTGSGTGEPTGFVSVSGVGRVGQAGQTITVIYDDLVDMAESVDAGHPTLSWMMNQTTRKMVRRVKDTAGRPVWEPSILDSEASPTQGGMLLGYPVRINNDMAVPAANAKSMAFGNFKKYMVRDALEVTLFRFDDSTFTTRGQVGFLAWARAGGNLLDLSAIKLYQHSAT